MTTVLGEGPGNAKVAIVGEAPGDEEDAQGRPFVGSSGRLLNRLLREAGIKRDDCYVTNVVKERPPNKDMGHYYKDAQHKRPTPALLDAREELGRELREVNPNVVIVLGREGLKALYGKEAISKWRGSVVWSPSIEAKVVPTYHPAYVFRQAIHRPVVAADIKKAAKESETPTWTPKEYNFHTEPSFEKVMECIDMARQAGTVAFDIETLGTQVRCLGIAWSEKDALCIPFIRVQGRGGFSFAGSSVYFSEGQGANHYWTEDQEVAVLEKVNELLGDPEVRKVAQNYPFDGTILEYEWGIVTRGLWMDTMALFHALWPELEKSLDFLTSLYTSQPYYAGVDTSVDHDVWEYNQIDCCVTWEVAWKIKDEADELGMWDFYKLHIESSLYGLTRMQNRGTLLDTAQRDRIAKELREEIEDLRHDLQEIGPRWVKRGKKPAYYERRGIKFATKKEAEEDARKFAKKANAKIKDEKALITPGGPKETVTYFNPSSDDQARKFLYDDLGLPVQYHKDSGRPTSNEPALKVLVGKAKDAKTRESVELLLRYRKVEKLLEYVSIRPDADGRARTSYNVSGTKNGRISSSQSIWGSGANLQQQPNERGFRRIYVADEGYQLVKVDLSQAEVRIVAWVAPLPYLKDRFLHDPSFDIHRWAAASIFSKDESEITKEERSTGKIGVHGGNYGLGPRGAVNQFDVSYKEAQRALSGYQNALHPDLQEWWASLDSKVKDERCVSTPWGRRRTFLGRVDNTAFRSAYSFVPQAMVGDVINRAAAVAEWVLSNEGGLPLLQVHDELVFEVPNENMESALPKIRALMEPPIHVDRDDPLIIPSEISIGPNWKDVEEVALPPKPCDSKE